MKKDFFMKLLLEYFLFLHETKEYHLQIQMNIVLLQFHDMFQSIDLQSVYNHTNGTHNA